MSKVKINTIANYSGTIWTALLALISIPIFLKYLGPEAFALISISAAIAVIFSLSDFGISASVTREMARDWESEAERNRGRDVLKTLAVLYVPLVIALGVIIVLVAPYIASDWLNPDKLDKTVITHAVMLIGVSASVQLMSAFFNAALMGLQRQLLSNILGVSLGTIQVIGAVVALKYFGIGIEGFFIWQLTLASLYGFIVAFAVYRVLPVATRAGSFKWELLKELWAFSLGVSGIGILSIILTQTDKVVLSKILTLESFGYYSLALAIAMSLKRLFGPLFAAVYPRFTELLRKDEKEILSSLYHVAVQAISTMLFPFLFVIVLFAVPVVYAWTGDMRIAEDIEYMVIFLVAGTVLNGLMQIPYALQLASGWLRLVLISNAILVVFYVPGVYYLGQEYGGAGAAFVWFVLNFIYVVALIPIIHNRLLPGELRKWYLNDTLLPMLLALFPVIFLWSLFELSTNRIILAFELASIFIISGLMALLGAGTLRSILWEYVRNIGFSSRKGPING